MMRQRQTHVKSRNGCQGCKKRHVKCDEQGPPCANCVIRNTPCVYPPPPASRGRLARRKKAPAALPSSSESRSSSSSGASTSPGKSRGSLSPLPAAFSGVSSEEVALVFGRAGSRDGGLSGLTPTISISPAAFSSISSTDRRFEMELMHRWSVRSWRGFQSIPDCQDHIQGSLTGAALAADYMMNGILATAAADAALHGGSLAGPVVYKRLALEYAVRASTQFRATLAAGAERDSLWLLSSFSCFMGCVHMALPPDQSSRPGSIGSIGGIDHSLDEPPATRLSQFAIAASMVVGSMHIATIDFESYLAGPTSAAAVIRDYPFDLGLYQALDADTKTAVERLSAVSRTVRLPPTGDPMLDSADGQGPFADKVQGYNLAVGQTKYSFAEDRADRVKGYFLSAVSIGGTDFVRGLRANEPVALFVAMYLAVLMDRTGRDGVWWWIRSSGRELVAEISELLAAGPVAGLKDIREGIAWTRGEVGLPPLPGMGSVLVPAVEDLG